VIDAVVGSAGGRHTSESNRMFDLQLKASDPRWGVRNLDDVIELAQTNGLQFLKRIQMPANNFTVIFEKLSQ